MSGAPSLLWVMRLGVQPGGSGGGGGGVLEVSNLTGSSNSYRCAGSQEVKPSYYSNASPLKSFESAATTACA
eukprot:5861276-Amphidinium_carterae.2